MNIKKIIILLMICASILAGPALSQETITIRIGSSSWKGSPWNKTLEKLARQWEKITGGKVKLKINYINYAGNEGDIVRDMGTGKLAGAALFNRGMPRIYPEIYVLNLPLLIDSKNEFDYVFAKMKPFFEKGIEERGFKVITWTLTGWVRLFTKKPVFYPGDLKEHKIAFTTWNPGIEQSWRELGFDIVPTDSKNLMMKLQSGKVDAFFHLPQVAASSRYFTLAPNMSAVKADKQYWAIVLTKKTWEKIPDRYKHRLQKAAHKLANDLYEEVTALDNEAIKKMEDDDLISNKLPANALEKWMTAVNKGAQALIGKAFTKSVYDRFLQHLKEYRGRRSSE